MKKLANCHEIDGDEDRLTYGKLYEYRGIDEESIEVFDDNGEWNWYCIGAFEVDVV